MKKVSRSGFTLVEVLLVIAIMAVTAQFSMSVYRSSVGGSALSASAEELIQNITRAREFAVSGYLNSNWGVYFDNVNQPHSYTVFKGANYAARDTGYDENYQLEAGVSFDALDIGGSEVVFVRPDGTTSQTGTITLQNLEGKTASAQINALGRISNGQNFDNGQPQNPQTVNAAVSADAHMYKFSSSTNYGTDVKLWVQSWATNYHRRGIIRFDLSAIPASATVTAATLKLYLYNTQGTARTYGAHKIVDMPARDWTEAGVTWNKYTASNNWSLAGGDFIASATDTETAGSWPGTGYWVEWDVSADAQTFVADPAINFGWVIKDENESGSPQYYVYFAADEYSDDTKRPVLEVTYE